MTLRGWVASSALVFTGCLASTGSAELRRSALLFDGIAPPPARWHKVVTADYTLMTDLDAVATERAAQLLSQSIVGLGAMFSRAPVLRHEGLTIIALADSLDFERRFGKRLMGFTHYGDDESNAVICLYGQPDKWFERSSVDYEAKESVLQHELAHAVLRRYFPQQARWFSEGMAQYLETFRWLDEDTVQLGEPKLLAYRNYRAIRSVTVADALAWDGRQTRELQDAGMYAMSWAMVHYMRNQKPRAFGTYLQLLAQSGPKAAWGVAFSQEEDALDQQIFLYLKAGQYQFFTIKVPVTAPAHARVEAATADEAHLVETALDAMSVSVKNSLGPK